MTLGMTRGYSRRYSRRYSLRCWVMAALAGAAWGKPRAGEPEEAEQGVVAAINEEREREGLAALRWNERVARVARGHSEEMARGRYFRHDNLKSERVSERLRGAGVRFQACGENLYWQPGGAGLAEKAVAGWMQSGGHRENVLGRRYREAGAGVAVDGRGRWVVTLVFVG